MKGPEFGPGIRRVLVAGGAGFLGSYLCDALLAQGCAVLCVDNFHTGDADNVAHLRTHPHFELLEHDVTLPLSVAVDAICNLACPASPVHYARDPVYTTRTCVLGTMNLLELARQLDVPLLQASTSEVYGDPQVHPQPEDYWGNVNPVGVRACYDEGKRCAETLCMDYARRVGAQVKIARIFNTYGPRMQPQDGRVVSNFITQALDGQPLTVYGDGAQTRSFCYVDDLIAGLLRLLATPAAFHGPVNIGNPGEVTMLELAQRVVAACGASAGIVFRALPADDPARRCPDISRARAVLGWQPQIALETGLARTIAWFRSQRLEQHLHGHAQDNEVRPWNQSAASRRSA